MCGYRQELPVMTYVGREIIRAFIAAPAMGDTAVGEVQPDPFRNIILFLLLGLAAAAWVALVWPAHNMTMHITMPTTSLHALRFLAIWVVMMVAMMLPAAAPMILAFHNAQTAKRHPGVAFDSTWAFVAAYLLVWAVSGIAAYAGVLAAAAAQPALGPALAAEVGGLILMVAGIYQLTPLKQRCLSECRRPIIMTSWHHSAAGAFRMGLLHGAYCLGCYWLLFVSLFPLGMTNAAMAAVTLVIFAEKTLSRPEFASYGAAVVLMLCGLLMAVAPGLPAVFGFFGRLSEDVWFRLGLVAWIMVLFIAANAARPKR